MKMTTALLQKKYNLYFSMQEILRLVVFLFLISPFILLLTQFKIHGLPEFGDFFWALRNSFVQSLLSAFFSIIIGFWFGLGLIALPKVRWPKLRNVFEILCLLPNFLPPIFTLLSALNIIDPFPMGVFGIVLIHSIMNFGLVAVLTAGIIEKKAGSVIELAFVEGATRLHFLYRGLLPMIYKDIWSIGLFVFIICFQSFSIPLIVGGGRGTTLEVLIYEKIRLSGEWSGAVFLSIVQSIFIFLISLSLRNTNKSTEIKKSNLQLVQSPLALVFIFAFFVLYFVGYLDGILSGIQMVSTFYEYQSGILWSFLGSLAIGLTVGSASFLGLMAIAFSWPKKWFTQFLRGYLGPSTSLACFAFLILGPNGGLFSFLKISAVITLLSLCNLFRLGWLSEMNNLDSQIEVATTMGASPRQIFREITFPQIFERAGILSGIASVWACGDFAVSRILANQDLSLGMMTETLMSSYRLSQASILSLLIIIVGLMCYLFCVGGSRVLGRKFKY